MQYLADIQSLPSYGQYTIEALSASQAATWLSSGSPLRSRLRHSRIEELVATVTGYVGEDLQEPLSPESHLEPLAVGDQVLSCYVKSEIFLNAPKWYDLGWTEQLDRLRFVLLTYDSCYTDDETLDTLPVSRQEYIMPPPLRVVIGEPSLPGTGRFNFQRITQEQAQAWLSVAFRSRLRLGKQALALEMLTGVRMRSNFDNLPPLRPCDQALVFFPGSRCRSRRLRDMRAEAMMKQLDLALITPLPEPLEH